MQTRIIGNSLKVSALGLGCMGMTHAYGEPLSSAKIRDLIGAAVDLGYTFFDTAEVYGTASNPHLNEEELGQALKPYRHLIVIGTKFGIHFDLNSPAINKPLVPDARPEVIRRSVEASLTRLKTDHIDIYYQHRQDPKVPVEEVARVMEDLIRAGKILHWGLSEVDEDTLRRAHAVCPVSAVQNRYSMMARHYESLFPALAELKIALIAFSPMANGVLSGAYDAASTFDQHTDYRSSMPQFTPEAMQTNQDLFDLLKETAAAKNATMGQISLAWMLCKKPWIIPIPGTTKPERLKQNALATEIRLSEAEVRQLDEALDRVRMSAVFGGSRINPQ